MQKYGIQLYSVRDIAKENLRDALKQVAKMGYAYVEFAGFFGNSAEDVKAWLDEYGIKAIGTYTSITALTPENIDATIAYHKGIECKNLIVPGAKWDTMENFEDNFQTLCNAKNKLAEAGISLGYHNHSFEFYMTPYGKLIEDEIIERTDIMLEIDVFWLFNAGIDIVPYLEKHKNRIKMIHLKDGHALNRGKGSFENSYNGAKGCSVGLGDVPVLEVREWALKNNVTMVVESEDLNPSGPEEVRRCIEFLNGLEA